MWFQSIEWKTRIPTQPRTSPTTCTSRFHPRSHVDSVSKETVSWHGQAHNTCSHWSTVDPSADFQILRGQVRNFECFCTLNSQTLKLNTTSRNIADSTWRIANASSAISITCLSPIRSGTPEATMYESPIVSTCSMGVPDFSERSPHPHQIGPGGENTAGHSYISPMGDK